MINYQRKITDKNTNRGFTLIELMVSMSIFMVVMLLALGSLVNISNTSKKARALHQAMDNVNFAMESMTRSLRTGSHYYCTSDSVVILPATTNSDCLNGGSAIVFTPQKGSSQNTMYRLSNSKLEKCTDDSANPCVPMTSSDVVVDNLIFYVRGADSADTLHPSVYISMSGYVSVGDNNQSFALQTLVSQRSSED